MIRRVTFFVVLIAIVHITGPDPAHARPDLDRITLPDLSPSGTAPGLFPTAVSTTYFGGTAWAADSSRWEALPDSCWTFDSGVGSHFDHSDPDVDPFKDPTLHARMEGWVGIDLGNRHDGVNKPFTSGNGGAFRRLSEGDFSTDVCVGATGGLGDTDGGDQLAGDDARHIALELCRGAITRDVRRRHIGVYQHCHVETREGAV